MTRIIFTVPGFLLLGMIEFIKYHFCLDLIRSQAMEQRMEWSYQEDTIKEMLKNSLDYGDVTLMFDDKTTLTAHRVILASQSEVFKSCLDSTVDLNPTINVTGIERKDMEILLECLYFGEKLIPVLSISILMDVARTLGLQHFTQLLTEEENKHKQKPSGRKRKETKNEIDQNCDKCDLKFESYLLFSNHFRYMHDKDVKLYCHICHQDFASQSGAYTHKKTLHDGVKFPCNHCDYRTARQDNLRVHIESKHSLNKLNCDHCEFTSGSKQTLKQHIQAIHKGIRFICKQCNQELGSENSLKNHIKFKHEEIKFPCTECNFIATSKGWLNKHYRRQHEDFKFPCSECNHEATSQGRLDLHFRKLHEGFTLSQI